MKPKMKFDKINLISQYKTNLLISLEAKKKLLLTSELVELIKNNLNEKDFEKFMKHAKNINYNKLKELIFSIYIKKCVQKKIDLDF